MNTLKGEHYKILPDGEVQVWGLETEYSFANGTLTLMGETLNIMAGTSDSFAEVYLPKWLADGIRELVKNKIEQENNRGA